MRLLWTEVRPLLPKGNGGGFGGFGGCGGVRTYARWWPFAWRQGSPARRAQRPPPRPARRHPPPPLKLPTGKISPNDLEMNLILGRTLNRASSSSIRCTLVDADGRVKISQGEFKRSDLVAQFGLLPRDLRKLDVSTHNIVPTILVREQAIVVNLLHIRAIIKSDCVLLVDSFPASPEATKIQSLFLYDLEHKLRAPSGNTLLTYEQRALETILISVATTLDAEFKVHEQLIGGVLSEIERSLDRQQLQHLLVQSKNLGAFLQKASLIRDALQELIDSDKDMKGLFLSKAPPEDDSDVEVMLESYYSQCDETVQVAENLAGNIRSTEEYINILLDSNRNSLMLLEVRFQIGMLGLSCGSAVAALYGMNLQNMIEDTSWGFVTISGLVGALSLATVALCLRRLARIGKINERFMK